MARGSCSGTIAAVQLLSWCAAGALLVYRGVVTLRPAGGGIQRRDETNATAVELRRGNDTADNGTLAGRNGTAGGADVRPAALAMLAVGAVMLAVGPAVLALRRCDTDRRRRRFLKLSSRDPDDCRDADPPPSYEEAADGVPRYSALFQELDFGEAECSRTPALPRLPAAPLTAVQ